MPSESLSRPIAKEKPAQFTLRQLVYGITLSSAFLAFIFYWDSPGFLICLGIAAVLAMCYGAYWREAVSFLSGGAMFAFAATFVLWPAISTPLTVARQHSCGYNLKDLGLSLANYHDDYGSFPPAYVVDASGRPMHSWRVLLLPYMDEAKLYEQYDFNEPWNGPNNSKLIPLMPRTFRCPSEEGDQTVFETSYLAVIGPEHAWRGTNALKYDDFTDGTSNAVQLVEVCNSGIVWTEPRDLHVLQMSFEVNPWRGQGVSSKHGTDKRDVKRGAHVLFADGHIQYLENNTPPETLRSLLTIGGGENIVLP